MVRADFHMDVRFPVLTEAGMARVERAAKRVALRRVRREIATPARKRFAPVATGELKKSIRGSNKFRRRDSRTFMVLAAIKFRFWYFFQDRAWLAFRGLVNEQGRDIVQDAISQALRDEGFG